MKWTRALLLLVASLTLALYAPKQEYRVYLPLVNQPYVPLASKKGVGMSYHYCEDAARVGAAWSYNWGAETFNCPGIENVPMAWSSVPNAIGGNSEWLMGPNEPDQASQANLSPAQAATRWRQLEQKFPTKKLVAPVPSQEDVNWLARFREAYFAQYGMFPRLDALAMHYYGDANGLRTLVEWYKARANEWGVREIWVTEFAHLPCWYGMDESVRQLKQMVSLFEREPMVSRFAWFEARYHGDEPWASGVECNTSLVDWTGQLTPLGKEYSR